MLALIALLFTAVAAAAVAAWRPLAQHHEAERAGQRDLALARDALRGEAWLRHCANRTQPIDALLVCPEAPGLEGIAAASCPGITRGWLPWCTLGLPPLRDASGTCLWMEREGATVRVIARGFAGPTQSRPTSPGRSVCGGSDDPAQYLDATDAELPLVLDAADLAAVCP